MSNPFGEPNDDGASGEILEGFLCPICREDFKSVESLTGHFEREHAGEQDDASKSIFMDILKIAKKKIRLNFDDSLTDLSRSMDKSTIISGTQTSSTSNTRTHMNVYNFMDHQTVGMERTHFEFFQSVRNPRLERYASETNKLIIRIHRLLKDMPTDPVLRKQHEQMTVSWLDGSSVKLCPSCAKSFHIARRQHHCRLCGSIMCHDCSKFLGIKTALELASLSMSSQSEPIKQLQAATALNPQQSGIRCCDHCLWLLETREEMHESRTCCPPIMQIYTEISHYRKNVVPDVVMYLKIVSSLYEGESIFTINDASALRGKIGQIAEIIDVLSKRVLALPCAAGSREEALKKAIRLSCVQMIKDKMLSLPPLPAEEAIRKIQERKRMEAEQRIETERRQAQEAYERYGLANSVIDKQNVLTRTGGTEGYAQGSDLCSLDNWTAHQVSAVGIVQSDDPLVEQINIIKGYIKQARKDLNFDVVETLETNLRELQREFYQRQRSSIHQETSPNGVQHLVANDSSNLET